MDTVLELAERLAGAINQHEYYIDYIKARDNVENNYQLKNMLNDYRKMQFELAIKQDAGYTGLDQEEAQLENEYSQLQASPEASEFLNLENQLLHLISKVFNIINEEIPIDLDF